MKGRFEDLRDKVLKRAETDPVGAAERGDKREALVQEVLQKMKDEEKILDFVKTTKFGEPDIVEGIDFYIVIMRNERIVVPIQVTGLHLVEEHEKKHPKIPIIIVFEEDKRTKEYIEVQIERVIKKY